MSEAVSRQSNTRVASPRKIRKPSVSVANVSSAVEPIAGSLPERARVRGATMPLLAPTNMLATIAVVIAIDDEDLVGLVRQLVEAAQIAQHDFERDVVANRDPLEIHARADRLFRIADRANDAMPAARSTNESARSHRRDLLTRTRPATAHPNAIACANVNDSPRNTMPTSAAVIGSATVNTPA